MTFQKRLLDWYGLEHRNLPWRLTSNPYNIWISEVMLQQTQVQTVIDYYNRFIQALPTIESLAEAEDEKVLKLWEGLGYYSRAKNLMACAKVLVNKYQGQFPTNFEEVIKLPGIGPYTAGAILSIAYNQPVAAVDGNVMRVISRYFNMTNDISDPKSRKKFEAVVTKLLPENRSHFNQALMELGATICTPSKASCMTCPVAQDCSAYALDLVNMLPVKSKKITKIKKQVAIAYVKFGSKVLITKREEGGLLGGIWGFPLAESPEPLTEEDLNWELKTNWGIEATPIGLGIQTKHVFTHLIWEMQVYEYCVDKEYFLEYPPILWVEEENLHHYPFPIAFKKLIQH